MKVAIVSSFYPPRHGGSAHLSQSIAEDLDNNNDDVLVMTVTPDPANLVISNANICRLRSWKVPKIHSSVDFDLPYSLTRRNLKQFFQALDDFGPEIINVHGQFLDLSWIAFLYARKRKIPCLLTVHTRLESPNRFVNSIFKIIDKLFVSRMIRLAQPDVVVMDRLMDEYIHNRYLKSIGEKHSIPVGVKDISSSTHQRPDQVRNKYEIGTGPIWLSIGHVIPVRDRLLSVEALAKLVIKQPDLKLVVVGEVFDDRFLQRAKELRIEKSIQCLGVLNRSEIGELLSVSAVEAHDLQGLGLGTASLEAMLAGVPVVTDAKPDNFPNFPPLQHGKHLLILKQSTPHELAEAIWQIIADSDVSKTLTEGGSEYVRKNFLIDKITNRYSSVMQNIIDQKYNKRTEA